MGPKIAGLLNSPEVLPWLYWVPASTLLTGIYQSLNYWSNRRAHYSRLAISRVFQSIGASVGLLGMGFKGAAAGGLIAGQVFGQLISTVLLAKLIKKDDRKLLKSINMKDALTQASVTKTFPSI